MIRISPIGGQLSKSFEKLNFCQGQVVLAGRGHVGGSIYVNLLACVVTLTRGVDQLNEIQQRQRVASHREG